MAKVLVLVAPELLAQPADALARMRPLAVLGRYAGRPIPAGDPCAALCASLDMPGDTPIAPLALLGASGDPDDDFCICAQPMHIAPGADHTLDLTPIADLGAPEVAALIRMLDRHFADDDLRFEAPTEAMWFGRRRGETNVSFTAPWEAQRRPLAASVPRGADSSPWKRWQDEIAMLLHDHPVNREREASHRPIVNAVWFFGAGRLREVAATPDVFVVAPRGLVGHVALGIARHGRRRPMVQSSPDLSAAISQADALASPGAALAIVVFAVSGEEEGVIAKALAHLESRDVEIVRLIAAGGDAAKTWSAHRPGWWRRAIAHAVPSTRGRAPRT